MKKIIIGVITIGVLVAIFYIFNAYIYNEKQAPAGTHYKSAEYRIDGTSIQLKDGFAEIETIPGSVSKVTTRYFGNEYRADLDDDGREDVVFLLTQETGGSGVFYYAVAALNTEQGYIGSDGYLLGDRIAPQTIQMSANPRHTNVVVVNYAERGPDEPMTTQPSIGKSVYLKLDTAARQWGVVDPDFSGEANPDSMSLTMKPWVWQQALYNDGREIKPHNPDSFKLTFMSDNTVSVSTDCNSVSSEYMVAGNQITFTNMHTTLMYCEHSQETEFLKLLENTQSFHFSNRGELIFDLKFDSGTVTFR